MPRAPGPYNPTLLCNYFCKPPRHAEHATLLTADAPRVKRTTLPSLAACFAFFKPPYAETQRATLFLPDENQAHTHTPSAA